MPRFFYTTGIDTAKNELVVKVVQGQSAPQDVVIDISGAHTSAIANGLVLSHSDVLGENSLESPLKISPIPIKAKINGGRLVFTAQPYSLTIFRVALQ